MSYAAHGYGRQGSVEGFVVAFGLGIIQIFPEDLIPSFVYTIVEEIRIAVVWKETRDTIMAEESRGDSVKFEDRVVRVPRKLD